MVVELVRSLRRWRDDRRFPREARALDRLDRKRPPAADPGPEAALAASARWIGRAQDCSASADGGIARHFGFLGGWSVSYPESSGYTVPTLIALSDRFPRDGLLDRARRVLDWLVSVQREDGAFDGGTASARGTGPVAFNTGQILLGLAAGTATFGSDFREPMRRAADWMVSALDSRGSWRRFDSPFTAPGDKAYDVHAAWGLLEADRVDPGRGYLEAALSNVSWAVRFQRENGWVAQCCLSDPAAPLTHTLGYFLRGVTEAWRSSEDEFFLEAARRTADGLLLAMDEDGRIPGRLDALWKPAAAWVCVTGSAQIAASWILLHRGTKRPAYLEGATRALRYVRRTVAIHGDPDRVGAVRGSYPVSGDYCRYQFPGWACKFFVDAQLLEMENGATLGPPRESPDALPSPPRSSRG